MSYVPHPLEAARKASTEEEAARLRDDIDTELAMNPNLPESYHDEAEKALAVLNERHDLEHVPFGEGYELGPRGRRFKRSGRAVTRHGRNRPAPSPSSTSGARRRSGGGRRRGARRSGVNLNLYPGLGGSLEQTGVPGAARDTYGLVMQALGVFVGFGLLYLLINEAGPGPGAFSKLLDGIGIGVDALIRDVDPLAGVDKIKAARAKDSKATAKAATKAAAAPVGTSAPAGVSVGQFIALPGPAVPPLSILTP